jgi:hypothetical protein
MATNPKDQEWYSIAEQLSKEINPAKLGILVLRLCAALDKRTTPRAAGSRSAAEASSVVLASSPAEPSQSAERCSHAGTSGPLSEIDCL